MRDFGLRDISETMCIYNVLYATNPLLFQSIFFFFGKAPVQKTDVSRDYKTGCMFFVILQWLLGYKYQYIVLFFS